MVPFPHENSQKFPPVLEQLPKGSESSGIPCPGNSNTWKTGKKYPGVNSQLSFLGNINAWKTGKKPQEKNSFSSAFHSLIPWE